MICSLQSFLLLQILERLSQSLHCHVGRKVCENEGKLVRVSVFEDDIRMLYTIQVFRIAWRDFLRERDRLGSTSHKWRANRRTTLTCQESPRNGSQIIVFISFGRNSKKNTHFLASGETLYRVSFFKNSVQNSFIEGNFTLLVNLNFVSVYKLTRAYFVQITC